MGIEIERKFLVKEELWQTPTNGLMYRQGYIYTLSGNTVRVRTAGDKSYLTLKSKTKGSTRQEFEYSIPLHDANEMLITMCDRPLIEKIRYKVLIDNLEWEVDQFLGDNQGLLLAEVELTSEEQTVKIPPWIGKEVTHDQRYYNLNLVKNPYKKWK